MQFEQDLKEKGYAVIENVLTEDEVKNILDEFYKWVDSNTQIKQLHNKIDPHGIFKYMEVGQQRHAWLIRTHPKVKDVFSRLWNTNDLVVSYDGCCWIPTECKKADNIWTHTDQAVTKEGLRCYQGFVSLTDNIDRSLVVYEGSHLLHAEYGRELSITSRKDWLLIEHYYLQKIADRKKVLNVKAGSLIVWDSRTFHQNQYGTLQEERIVQYVSYLPKSGRSKKMREKREKYFIERRTTSHWAYPVKVNSKQPQNYGNSHLIIDYGTLQPPDLEDLMPEIEKLI
jgi:hypothetical protein